MAGIDDETTFEENHTAYDAVERCLERISEAAKRLGPVAETLCPELSWRRICGLGNVLRYNYDRIASIRIWCLVQDDLPELKSALQAPFKSFNGYACVSAEFDGLAD